LWVHIGIIDDDELDRFVASRVLARLVPEAALSEFACGAEALAAARLRKLPKILFVDINMPNMSGFDLLSLLPSPGEHSVAILSSSNSGWDRRKAAEFDCVAAFVEKPLSAGSARRFLGV